MRGHRVWNSISQLNHQHLFRDNSDASILDRNSPFAMRSYVWWTNLGFWELWLTDVGLIVAGSSWSWHQVMFKALEIGCSSWKGGCHNKWEFWICATHHSNLCSFMAAQILCLENLHLVKQLQLTMIGTLHRTTRIPHFLRQPPYGLTRRLLQPISNVLNTTWCHDHELLATIGPTSVNYNFLSTKRKIALWKVIFCPGY